MGSINVMNDINYNVKNYYYEQIVNKLQEGWTNYIEERSMCEWLSDDENIYNTDFEYEWYNQCWKDWIKYNYEIATEYPRNIYQHIIWDELLAETKYDNISRLKIIFYILLISFGFYVTNQTIFNHRN